MLDVMCMSHHDHAHTHTPAHTHARTHTPQTKARAQTYRSAAVSTDDKKKWWNQRSALDSQFEAMVRVSRQCAVWIGCEFPAQLRFTSRQFVRSSGVGRLDRLLNQYHHWMAGFSGGAGLARICRHAAATGGYRTGSRPRQRERKAKRER